MMMISGQQATNVRALRDKAAAAKLGVSRAHLWELSKRDESFPRPTKISPGVTIWLEAELDAWLLKRVAAARQS
jgi:prophage regulatory protein